MLPETAAKEIREYVYIELRCDRNPTERLLISLSPSVRHPTEVKNIHTVESHDVTEIANY
jgi:hypothetical protein